MFLYFLPAFWPVTAYTVCITGCIHIHTHAHRWLLPLLFLWFMYCFQKLGSRTCMHIHTQAPKYLYACRWVFVCAFLHGCIWIRDIECKHVCRGAWYEIVQEGLCAWTLMCFLVNVCNDHVWRYVCASASEFGIVFFCMDRHSCKYCIDIIYDMLIFSEPQTSNVILVVNEVSFHELHFE